MSAIRCCLCPVTFGLIYVRGYMFCVRHDKPVTIDEWCTLQNAKKELERIEELKKQKAKQKAEPKSPTNYYDGPQHA